METDRVAAPASGAGKDVLDEFYDDPTSFSFFQAVRLLERLRPTSSGSDGASSEAARFSVHASTAFPASEIQEAEVDGSGPVKLLVNFFGLTGPQGVLPYWYTHVAADRLRARDGAMHDFLDIFHHRAIGQLYRAWGKSRPFVELERSGQDRLSELLRAYVGLGIPGLAERNAVRDDSVLFYAALFANHHRTAIGLEQLLSDYFGVPAEVQQFVGGWYPLGEDEQCHLGAELGMPNALGDGAVVGGDVWDPQLRARVRLGPLTRADYDRFLPGGVAHDELREMCQLFAGDEIEFEVQLVLRQCDVPPIVLGLGQRSALGWTTWLATAPAVSDADDAVLTLSTVCER